VALCPLQHRQVHALATRLNPKFSSGNLVGSSEARIWSS
jgi:hypothetical protein